MNPVTVFRQEFFSPQKLGSTFVTGGEFPAHFYGGCLLRQLIDGWWGHFTHPSPSYKWRYVFEISDETWLFRHEKKNKGGSSNGFPKFAFHDSGKQGA